MDEDYQLSNVESQEGLDIRMEVDGETITEDDIMSMDMDELVELREYMINDMMWGVMPIGQSIVLGLIASEMALRAYEVDQ